MTTTTNEALEGQVTELVITERVTEDQARAMVTSLSRHWGVLLSFGIILGGLGIAMMVWPHATVGVAAILLAISLLVSGVFSIVAGFTQPDQQTFSRALMAISGVLSIGLGLVAFRGISEATVILALIVGIGWVFRGIFDLVTGFSAARGTPGRGMVITGGVLGLLAGAAVLFWPSITLVALMWVSGLSLLLVGGLQIVAAFKLRSVARNGLPEDFVIPAELVIPAEPNVEPSAERSVTTTV